MALKWTKRELRQAKHEKQLMWYRLPNTNDWQTAVKIAQRPFPGTGAWMLSCSDGEGGHGHWKPYHEYGSHYYAGYEHTDSVGGWMQFRPSTFRPYFPKALAVLRAKGFSVRLDERDWLKGWLDPLAQALTAGYMRSIGISPVHWSPSVDYKCYR